MREKDERERERAGQLWKGESSRAHHGYVHRLDKVATSFFFTNFSEDVKAIDLWPRFAKYGRVREVFIPAKVDKQGKRFGFVKYRDVQDAKELLRSISNIWIDSFKIQINLSKFSKYSEPGEAKRVEPVVAKSFNSGDGKITQGRSFKSALIDVDEVRRKTWGVAKVVTPVVAPEVVWEVEVEEERLMKLEGAYVGYLVEDRDIQTVDYLMLAAFW